MFTEINLLIDAIITVILVAPVIWGWQKLFHKDMGIKHRWLMVLFGCFIAEIFAITGIPSIWRMSADLSVNLVPFDALSTSPVQYCLNIILFLPIGIIAPLIWKQLGHLKNVILLGGGLSFFIEFMQMFNFRATDVDDLIANTAGAVLGFVLVKVIAGKRISREENVNRKEGREALTLCMLIFMINFTIQPILFNLVWSAIV